MTMTQTIEIPASRRIFLDLPQYLPVGKVKLELTLTLEDTSKKMVVPSLASLLGVDKDRDTMDAYFERKRVDKAKEDALYEQLQSQQ
jgi:hypothetical protein